MGFSREVSTVARTREELDAAWGAFEDPVPEKPEFDPDAEMVLVFGATLNCPSVCHASVYDCGEDLEMVLRCTEGMCDGIWTVGAVVVTAADERGVDFRAQRVDACGD